MSQDVEWITTIEAAEIMGVEQPSVGRLCKSGAILCRKWGNYWQVSKESAEAYIKTTGGRGKKVGGETDH